MRPDEGTPFDRPVQLMLVGATRNGFGAVRRAVEAADPPSPHRLLEPPVPTGDDAVDAAAVCRAVAEAEAAGPEVHCALLLASPIPVLAARWRDQVRRGETRSFADWLREEIPAPSPATAHVWEPLRTGVYVDALGAAIGEDRIVAVSAAPFRPGERGELLAGLLGLEPGRLSRMARTRDRFGYAELEMFRRVNQRRSGAWPVALHRAEPRRPPADGTTTPLTSVVAPPWAVEAANARLSRALVRIRTSKCRVVGPLDGMILDPPPAEAARAPETIPITSAGDLAFGLYEAARAVDKKQRKAAEHSAARAAERATREAEADGVRRTLEDASARQLLASLGRRAVRRGER